MLQQQSLTARLTSMQDEELKDSSYKQGGILTPGSAMGMILAERVQRAMGTFKIED